MKTLSLSIVTLLLAGCAQLSGQPPVADPLAPEPDRLRAHIEFLASDALRGRDTGSREYQISAEYVASQFLQLGLIPAGDNGSYFQSVALSESRLVEGSAKASILSEAGEVSLRYPEDFTMGPDRLNPVSEVSGEVVFVGYGIVAPNFDHDDYADLEVEGRIVAWLVGRPEAWPTEEGAYLASEKARFAAERGAAGVLVIHTPKRESVSPYTEGFKYLSVPRMNWVGPDGLPDGYHPELKAGAYLSPQAAELLFKDAPVSLDALYQADLDQTGITGFTLPVSVSLARKSSHRTLTSPNVVGVIKGSDPALNNEYLVYSGHLDHIGVIPGKEGEDDIYNGALDNAAGIATMLETARVLNAERASLKRSVMFLAVTGEEKGLLGSGYFASNPTVPIEQLVANVNLDMPVLTYPFADVVAFGANHSSLGVSVERAAEQTGLRLSPDPMPEQGLFTRSDHFELVKQGVPAVFLMTGFNSRDPDIDAGAVWANHLRTHYHQPSDDINLPIDYESGALFTEININIGREICGNAEKPRWLEGDFFGDAFAGVADSP